MTNYEYKVVNAPRKAVKVKGIRNHDDRFAQNLTDLINKEAEDDWEYQRAETLPVDEKKGLLGKSFEKYVPLLIFRRALTSASPVNNISAVISDIQTQTQEQSRRPSRKPKAVADEASDPTMLQTFVVEDDRLAADIIADLGPALRD